MASNSMAFDLIFAMVEKIQKIEAGGAASSAAAISPSRALPGFNFGAQLTGGAMRWSAAGTGGALTLAPPFSQSSHVEVAGASEWTNQATPSPMALGAPPSDPKVSLEDQHQPAQPSRDAHNEATDKSSSWSKYENWDKDAKGDDSASYRGCSNRQAKSRPKHGNVDPY